jgi:hypothetical protein
MHTSVGTAKKFSGRCRKTRTFFRLNLNKRAESNGVQAMRRKGLSLQGDLCGCCTSKSGLRSSQADVAQGVSASISRALRRPLRRLRRLLQSASGLVIDGHTPRHFFESANHPSGGQPEDEGEAKHSLAGKGDDTYVYYAMD